jgi:uncharacterized protein involved in type VI secretion and phage assembly
MSAILNIIRREIERFQSRSNHEMVGYIDSYNKADHTAKVKFPTELDAKGNPRITGWIPFKVAAGGAGASWIIGPKVGDQCTVSYLEASSEAGTITGFLHNIKDTPPVAASGEAVLRHTSTGNMFMLNADGSFQTTHKATGNYVKLDKDGNITANLTGGKQHYVGGDPALGHVMLPLKLSDGTNSPYAQGRKS